MLTNMIYMTVIPANEGDEMTEQTPESGLEFFDGLDLITIKHYGEYIWYIATDRRFKSCCVIELKFDESAWRLQIREMGEESKRDLSGLTLLSATKLHTGHQLILYRDATKVDNFGTVDVIARSTTEYPTATSLRGALGIRSHVQFKF